MALTSGQRLGAYEIVSALGVGGMGEVYRARDSKLQREVAIKVLPEALATDRDRLARFEREAQLLAALNHPHIAAIYGVDTVAETQFLVLELVDGDTLADRITRGGALALSEALAIARQIGEALQAAHDKGIIHRDLKPANIALTSDGQVKVLDFGLAKAMEGAPTAQSSAPAATLSPTLSLAMTEAGFILGTAAYMSPEQAKGRPADKRSDVWAFGCVLFEMLTGKRAFEGEDASDTLAGILRGEPAWKALPRNTPPHVREVLTGCLAKDRKHRLADIAVVNYLLTEGKDSRTTTGSALSGRQKIGLASAVAVALLAAVGVTWWFTRDRPSRLPIVRFTITPPPDLPIVGTNTDRQLAVSPDGSLIVYRSGQGLVLRRLSQFAVEPVRGIADARYPFWSPDGNWVGFVSGSGFEIQRVPVTGGPPAPVTATGSAPRGASWGPDQTIVYASADPATGLMSVPAGGGAPKVLTRADAAQGEVDHFFPAHLPDGSGVLFTITTGTGGENARIALLDLRTGKYETLIRGGSDAKYVDGYLVYAAAGGLRAIRFDAERHRTVGDPVGVVEEVAVATNGAAQFSVSRTGSLVYLASGAGGGSLRSLVWVDRKGGVTPIPGASGAQARGFQIPRLSGDDSRVAVGMDDQQRDIFIFEFATRAMKQITFSPALDGGPSWFPDDQRIIFFSQRDGSTNLYSQRIDGVGGTTRLTNTRNQQFLPVISPDGKLAVAMESGEKTGNLDIMVTRLDEKPAAGTAAGPTHLQSEALLNGTFAELHPEIYPDGRWIAYTSEETGRRHVIVRPFPNVNDAYWKVSTDAGGERPAWSRAGKELFYATLTGTIMVVRFEATPMFSTIGNPERLFDWPTLGVPGPARNYDVAQDGKRFLMISEGGADAASKTAPTSLSVAMNWLEELKDKLPAK